jgi:hypothetical protein
MIIFETIAEQDNPPSKTSPITIFLMIFEKKFGGDCGVLYTMSGYE